MKNKLSNENILPYLMAGQAVFTILNERTKQRLTYGILVCKEDRRFKWVYAMMTQCNELRTYTYIGTIFGNEFKPTKKSKVPTTSLEFEAFYKYWTILMRRKGFPDYFHTLHHGTCGHCGRILTVPKSIELGIGPICGKHDSGDTKKAKPKNKCIQKTLPNCT